MKLYLVRLAFIATLGVLVGLLLRQIVHAEDVPVSKITASAEWVEGGVVVILPAPLPGSEYKSIWIGTLDGSVIDVVEPDQLSENSWSVPWEQGIIGGVLCSENSCTIFSTEWAVPSSGYHWSILVLVVVVGLAVAVALARWADGQFS